MKKTFFLFATFFVAVSLFAQAPQKMSYQAVIRDGGNQLVANQNVGIRISILQGSIFGASVFVETHSITTNINGLASLEIGTGTLVFGDFTTIDWSNGPYFIKTETDPLGGVAYSITGTSEILSVPYALYAKEAETIAGGLPAETDPVFMAWDKDYYDLINTPVIPTVPTNVSAFTNDAGYLTSFTESQILSISNDTIFLTGGSFVKLPEGFSGDYNDLTNQPTIPTVPTNVSAFTNDAGYLTQEVQVLSISNDTIYLTGGSFVKLPAGFSGDYNDLINQPSIPTVPTNVSAFTNDAGYLTNESQTLHLSGDTLSIAGGNSVVLPASGVSGGGFEVFTTSGTFTVPEGVTQIIVEVVGGGGGGCGGSSFEHYGGGGGGGGYGKGFFSVAEGTNYTVTVGSAGIGGIHTSGFTPGTAGGTSSFGSLISATGGLPGTGENLHGNGGTSSAPFYGVGTRGAINATVQSGYPSSTIYGTGGGGGYINTYNGKDGYSGVVIVYW